ncbi:hypothetical protein BDW69DRAFT_196504 [Aspergillus filifer]
MTTRGKPPSSNRPISPPDPTLTTRPVPKTRILTPHSYGPGTAPNISTLIRPLSEVKANSNPSKYLNATLLEDEEGQDLPIGYGDPTWGLYAFVVDYDTHTLSRISGAMENLVHVTRRSTRAQTTRSYADEAIQQFKIDVVPDETPLAGASPDRLREEFRAYLRYQRLLGEDNITRGGARNYVCLVLDRSTVAMLADLSLTHAIASLEDVMKEWRVLRGKTILLVDAWWERPATNWLHAGFVADDEAAAGD